MSSVEELLASANGKRRNGVLARADVDAAIDEARTSPSGIGVRHGGGNLLGKATLCLAVKDKGGFVVGIGVCWADRPTPGRVWKELGPWQADYARNVAKVAAWVKSKAADRVRVGAPAVRPKRGDGNALLADVLANPDDDAPRLVYADWLTQAGDPRGEFITVQCALARGAKTPAEKKKLVARERALFGKHPEWTKAARQIGRECVLRRGFVSSVKATVLAFATQGAQLFASDPVEELVVSHATPKTLEKLVAAPHFARLRAFRLALFFDTIAGLDQVKQFLRAPAVGQFRSLELSFAVWRGLDAASGLFAGISWPKVETLSVTVLDAPDAIDGLLAAKLPTLKQLILPLRREDTLKKFRAAFKKARVVSRL